MDLLNPTDFEILEVLSDGTRNIAANIAIEINANRGYINSRFSYLLNEDLVERVGPKEESGLYKITEKGKVAVEHKEKYIEDEVDDFEAFVESELED